MGTWNFDPYHTQVEFSAKHLGMMTVRGHFGDVTVTGDINPEKPETSKFEASIKTESIRTNNDQRDKDLRSSNFLEIDKFPTMHFKSTKIEATGGSKYRVHGDLTIKSVTKAVTFEAAILGEFNDPNMGHRYGYSAHGKINRKDFGMKFDMMLDGKFIVSDEIQITIEGELVEAKESATPDAAKS